MCNKSPSISRLRWNMSLADSRHKSLCKSCIFLYLTWDNYGGLECDNHSGKFDVIRLQLCNLARNPASLTLLPKKYITLPWRHQYAPIHRQRGCLLKNYLSSGDSQHKVSIMRNMSPCPWSMISHLSQFTAFFTVFSKPKDTFMSECRLVLPRFALSVFAIFNMSKFLISTNKHLTVYLYILHHSTKMCK